MNDTILIRYGELSTKGKNRYLFINQLEKNLKAKLIAFKYLNIVATHSRMLIYLNEHQTNLIEIEQITNIIRNTFGITSFSFSKQVIKDLNVIQKEILILISNLEFKSFKLDVNRIDKKFHCTSLEIINVIAGLILDYKKDCQVDLINPQLTIYLEIQIDNAFIMLNKITGLKGYPVGIAGKVLLLMSGGIDSPVSAYLLMKRGLEVHYLHFITPPYTKNESLQKVINLVKTLGVYGGNVASKLYICNFSSLQPSYQITIMRRMFMRIANYLGRKLRIKILATGDSLGQVASQTIESLSVIADVSDMVILRPLITYDKNEIINIAKNINTYETSIIPFIDCCSLFVPQNPVIKPIIAIAKKQEQSILWEEILALTVENNNIKQEINFLEKK
ncbi:tRNA uracil 4-sulfurtransferase ThiI [Spiroplasma endosymbiont of Eupeodes luniger]|uniref:tRNA uracil 4-sulfurtransferase ThiI n=1 Tax=Spiroplasma endosymbiont of Eupeodes luniger TaxID=3066300 RepID=UPI0030D1F4E2